MATSNWAWQFRHLAIYGELPLPEDLSSIGGLDYSSCEVTKRIREVIGLTAKIPKDFCGTFNVDGHKVHVFRHGETPVSKKTGRKYFQRMFIEVGKARGDFAHLENGCIVSDGVQLVPVGRLWQKFFYTNKTKGRP